jgi:type VI secretion system protein ImpH
VTASSPAQTAQLAAESWRYQLFQLLRILEANTPTAPRLGERGPARDERIRLRPSTSLGFPCAETVDIAEHIDPQGKPRTVVTANITGLYGVGSPLPRSYPHQILLQEDEQPQQRDFLDLLHHRLLSIWYRSWRQHRYEHSFRTDGSDPLSRALLDFIGVPPDATADDLGVEPVRLLRYLGLFVGHTRPAAGLETLLGEELELPLRVEEAPLRWVSLPKDQWPRLSSRSNSVLGRDVVIGTRHLARMTSLRLHIGPVRYATLLALWPDASLHRRLVALARFYLRQPLDLELHVEVPAAEVARTQLGGPQPSPLGLPASAGPPQRDPVVFVIAAPLRSPSAGANQKGV